MSDAFNPNDMILRFRERAEAVRKRGLPPVEGPERQMFMDAAKLDFQAVSYTHLTLPTNREV